MLRILLIPLLLSSCSSAPKIEKPAAKNSVLNFDSVSLSIDYSVVKRQATLVRSARLLFFRTPPPAAGEIATTMRCEVPLRFEIVGDEKRLNQSFATLLKSLNRPALLASDAAGTPVFRSVVLPFVAVENKKAAPLKKTVLNDFLTTFSRVWDFPEKGQNRMVSAKLAFLLGDQQSKDAVSLIFSKDLKQWPREVDANPTCRGVQTDELQFL